MKKVAAVLLPALANLPEPAPYRADCNGLYDDGAQETLAGRRRVLSTLSYVLSFKCLCFRPSFSWRLLLENERKKNKGKPVNPLHRKGIPICPYYAIRAQLCQPSLGQRGLLKRAPALAGTQ